MAEVTGLSLRAARVRGRPLKTRSGLFGLEFRQEGTRSHNPDGLELAECQQVLVAGDDDAGFDRDGGCYDVIVVGVTAGWADIR